MFSLSSRDQPVTVSFPYASGVPMSFVVHPGFPLVCEVPISSLGAFPISFSVVPLGPYATIDLLTYTDTPVNPEKFIWLRSGHGVETVNIGSQKRLLTWRDTRENSLATSYWWAPQNVPIVYDRDPDFNGQFSLNFPGIFGQQLQYFGTDLDALPVSDFTVMIVAYPTDDDSASPLTNKTMWATEKVWAPIEGGMSVWVDGGYRPGFHLRNEGQVGNLQQSFLTQDEMADKATVFIVENIGSQSRVTVYFQGKEVSQAYAGANVVRLKKFTIGGTYDIQDYPNWSPNYFKGRIADMKVHNRLLSVAEKTEYITYAAQTYGIQDTPEPTFPFVTDAVFFARSNRGFLPLSAVWPKVVGQWTDTRRDQAAYWLNTTDPIVAPVTVIEKSPSFNNQRAFYFANTQLVLTAAAAYYSMLGGNVDFTIGMVIRSDTQTPGLIPGPPTGMTLFSSRFSGSVGGTYMSWLTGGYLGDELWVEVLGANGTISRCGANTNIGPGQPAALAFTFDSAVEGVLYLQDNIDPSPADAGYSAVGGVPWLGGDATADSVQREEFVGEIVEVWWRNGLATAQQIADYKAYVTHRYGITNP